MSFVTCFRFSLVLVSPLVGFLSAWSRPVAWTSVPTVEPALIICDGRRGNPISSACVQWDLILIPPMQRLWIYWITQQASIQRLPAANRAVITAFSDRKEYRCG